MGTDFTDLQLRGAEPARWIVVNTQPHREQLALDNLARQNFAPYCPMVRRRVRHARRTQEVLRPLFPSYVFVRVELDLRRWRPILSTLGVRNLVRCGDRPSFIDDEFVANLKVHEVDGAVSPPAATFKVGEEVIMSTGPFDGLIATILEMTERQRLVVLMDLLKRPTKVTVDTSWVAPLRPAAMVRRPIA